MCISNGILLRTCHYFYCMMNEKEFQKVRRCIETSETLSQVKSCVRILNTLSKKYSDEFLRHPTENRFYGLKSLLNSKVAEIYYQSAV